MMNWTGGPDLLYRRHSYWSEVTSQRLTAAWRDTKGAVLSMYGESDSAAIDATDHQRIAQIANHYRPGSGQFVLVEKTGHSMQLDGTMAEVRAAAATPSNPGQPAPPKPYNPEITSLLANWVDATMDKPVTATSP
jgi:pimeloyl-ACP methyl ester carboxylesterase